MVPGVVDLSNLAAESQGVARIVLESVQDMLLKLALQIARADYEMRRERQRQGLELAKAAGKYAGRKADTATHARILALRAAGHSIERTADLAGSSASQVKRICAMHRAAHPVAGAATPSRCARHGDPLGSRREREPVHARQNAVAKGHRFHGQRFVAGSIVIMNERQVSPAGGSVLAGRAVVSIDLPEMPRLSSQGGSEVRLLDLQQRELDLNIVGSGDIEASGQVELLVVNIAGSGAVDARELRADEARLVSISELESLVGADEVNISATPAVKAMKPSSTWALPSGCELS